MKFGAKWCLVASIFASVGCYGMEDGVDETSGFPADEMSGEFANEVSGYSADEAAGDFVDEATGDYADDSTGDFVDAAAGDFADAAGIDALGSVHYVGGEMSLIDRPFGLAMGDMLRAEAYDENMDELKTTASICPGTVTIQGIDVSYYQGTINWSSVKADGKRFAMIRVSDGTTFMDPQFSTNWANAKTAGVFVGAYQFFRPKQDATQQADIMADALSNMGFSRIDLPPVIDVEVTDGVSNATLISQINIWLARVQARTGRLPVLYTSPGFWSSVGNPTPNPFPYLWLAHWTSSCPTVPPNWSELLWWQYSSTGKVSGISGNVDLDLFNGPVIKMIRL